MQIKIDKLIRSKRRTIALIIERDGSFTVCAPMRAPHVAIETFIQQKADWITRTRDKMISTHASRLWGSSSSTARNSYFSVLHLT